MEIDERLFKEYGKDFVKTLTRELIKAGKKNSGALINSLDYRIKSIGGDILIEVEALDYLYNVDVGRRPGSYPNINSLKRWASIKGIEQNAVFPIARSIYKYGIKKTDVISKTITKFENSFEVSDDIIEEIENIIVNKINNINNG